MGDNASRPHPGRALRLSFLLIALVAFLALPTFTAGNGGLTEEQPASLILTDLSHFRIQTRAIEPVVPEAGIVPPAA